MKKLFARSAYFAMMMTFSLQVFANSGLSVGDKAIYTDSNGNTAKCQITAINGGQAVFKIVGAKGLALGLFGMSTTGQDACSTLKPVVKNLSPEEAAKRIQLAKLERIAGEVVRTEPGSSTITDGGRRLGTR